MVKEVVLKLVRPSETHKMIVIFLKYNLKMNYENNKNMITVGLLDTTLTKNALKLAKLHNNILQIIFWGRYFPRRLHPSHSPRHSFRSNGRPLSNSVSTSLTLFLYSNCHTAGLISALVLKQLKD